MNIVALFSKIGNFLFGDEDDEIDDSPTTPKEDEKPSPTLAKETKKTKTEIKIDPIAPEDCWWEMEPGEKPKAVQLQGINSRQVYLELLNKIKLNNFTVIEIPDNLMKIIRLLNEKEFDYHEVEEIFTHSGSLAGEVIKIANSAVYSRGVKINRIRDALTRLGPNKIKAVLYLHSSRDTICKDERFVDIAKGIIDHCYVVGQIASYLSLRYYPDPDNAFLAGLMHDIGKLGIVKEISDFYDIPATQRDLAENSFGEVIPMLHELAGRFIAKNWNMSEDVSYAIENHHQPNHFLSQEGGDENTEVNKQLATLIHVCDIIARMNGKGNHIGKIEFFELPAVQHLGIVDDDNTKQFLSEIPRIVKAEAPVA